MLNIKVPGIQSLAGTKFQKKIGGNKVPGIKVPGIKVPGIKVPGIKVTEEQGSGTSYGLCQVIISISKITYPLAE